MAIATVYVPEYRNKLEDLLAVMKIAQMGYGIKTDYEQNKITKEIARQKRLENDAAEDRRQGIFSQEEYNAQIPAPVGEAGSVIGYIREAKLDEEGNRIKDDTGKDVTEVKPFSYFPKGYIAAKGMYKMGGTPELPEVQWDVDKQRILNEVKVNEALAASKGMYNASMLMNPDMVADYSFEPKAGYRKGRYFDQDTKSEKPVWVVTPYDISFARQNMQDRLNLAQEDRLRSEAQRGAVKDLYNQQRNEKLDALQEQIDRLRMQSMQLENESKQRKNELDIKAQIEDEERTAERTNFMNNPLVLSPSMRNQLGIKDGLAAQPLGSEEPPKNLTNAQKSGWRNAREHGIADPTEMDMKQWNPDQITKDVTDLSKRTKENNVPALVAALRNVDARINGIDSNKPIEGVGLAYAGADLPYVGPLFKGGQSQTARDNRQSLQGVVNIMLSMRSGAAVSQQEWERAAKELGQRIDSNSHETRNGLKNVRALLRTELGAIEAGYAKPSLDTFRTSPDAMHSNLPILQQREAINLVPKQFSPGSNIQDKIDTYLQGKRQEPGQKQQAGSSMLPGSTKPGQKPYTKGLTPEELDAEIRKLDSQYRFK